MRKIIVFTIVALAILSFGVTARMNTKRAANANMYRSAAETTPARVMTLKTDDKDFANKVALDGMDEVALAQLAVQKTKNPEVKHFAERMIADHSKANAELQKVASSKKISLPDEINVEQKAQKDKLSKLSGAEFDREYMSLMVSAHDKAVAAFTDESQNGSDAEIKAWAAKILPTLKEHQALAKDISAKLH